MWADNIVFGYIDPNTSQHVFSLLGTMLTLLAAVGGLVVASLVVIRHRVVSCFQNASRPKRIALVSLGMGTLAVVSVLVYRFLS